MNRADRRTPNRLRKYRLLHGYEQLDVALLLGLKSHARVSEWESGIARPSLSNLLQLSIIYRTLPDELYYDLRQELVKDMAPRYELLSERRSRRAHQDSGG